MKIMFNSKFQVKKVEKTNFHKFEEDTATKLKKMNTKRKQRKEGLATIASR